MTQEQRKHLLKLLPKGSIVRFTLRPTRAGNIIKVSDGRDCMVVLLNDIETPIAYSVLTCDDIENAEKVIQRLSK